MRRAILTLLIIVGCDGFDSTPKESPTPRPCTFTLRWTLPTERVEDESGYAAPLPSEDLEVLTLYAGRVPMAFPGDIVYTVDVDPLILSWQLFDQPAGLWFFTATVTDIGGLISEQSSEAEKNCG